MEDVQFEKYGSGYKTTLPQKVVDAIKGMMIAISNDMLNEYSVYLNEMLENQLIARYVSSVFFRTEGVHLLDSGFIVVDVIYDNRQIKVSMGKVAVGENKYELVSGILYNK